MNKTSKILSLMAGMGMLTSAAMAQDVKPIGIAIRVGLFFPTSNIATNQGKNWFGGGIEYKLGEVKGNGAGYRASYTLTAEVFSKGDLRTVPMLVNYVGQTDNLYYTAGAGVSFTRTFRGSNAENSTELAYALGIGREFKRGNMPFFVELRWLGNGESDLNGWTILGGVRF